MINQFSIGQPVKINRGAALYSEGVIESFVRGKTGRGHYYRVKLTGGVNCFNQPAEVGAIYTILHSNIETI